MKSQLLGSLLLPLFAATASAQAPEIIRYTFDSGDATNTAVPGIGNGTPQAGVSYAPSVSCATGQSAVSLGGTTAQINTGWQVDLGLSDWTVGMHIDFTNGSNGFQYYFGSSSTGGFRCFSGGAAGVDGIMLRTMMGGDVTIPGGAPAGMTTHVAWVHDASVPEVRGYWNGALVVTVPQTTPGTGVLGTATDFLVMNYSTNMLIGTAMDDFRFYRRAISAAEVAAWANCGGGTSIPTFCDPASNNSSGQPTRISGSFGTGMGSGLHLEAQQGPPGMYGYFLLGTSFSDPGFNVSNGAMCLAGSVSRFNSGGVGGPLNSVGQFNTQGILQNVVGTALSTGTASTGYDVPAMAPFAGSPAFVAGSTWYFQFWHQEAGGQSNFSQGLAVTF